MSRMAAIDLAVRLQLSRDGKTPGLGDSVGDQYGDDAAIVAFLMGVARTLRLDTPPLFFKWSKVEAGPLKGMKLADALAMIEEHTRSQPEA